MKFILLLVAMIGQDIDHRDTEETFETMAECQAKARIFVALAPPEWQIKALCIPFVEAPELPPMS